EKRSVEFEFVNITESMKNLKEFTALRDHRAEFEDARKNGYMGIPCLLTPEGAILFEEEILKNF
ncbi:MAG: glutaredoxin, partial [Filifactor alocis]|nr:glutaredoxin [Filifactor alocis]